MSVSWTSSRGGRRNALQPMSPVDHQHHDQDRQRDEHVDERHGDRDHRHGGGRESAAGRSGDAGRGPTAGAAWTPGAEPAERDQPAEHEHRVVVDVQGRTARRRRTPARPAERAARQRPGPAEQRPAVLRAELAPGEVDNQLVEVREPDARERSSGHCCKDKGGRSRTLRQTPTWWTNWSGKMAGLQTGAASRPETAVATVAAESTDARIRFGAASEWRVLVTLAARPLARLRVPDPGPSAGPATFDASVLAACDDERRRVLLDRRGCAQRIGLPAPAPTPRSVSVVVCTRDRLETLATLLDGARAGWTHGRTSWWWWTTHRRPGATAGPLALEAWRGLCARGRARPQQRAQGGRARLQRRADRLHRRRLRAAAARGWARCRELFEDGIVGAASGPAFPARLDTPSRGALRGGIRASTAD